MKALGLENKEKEELLQRIAELDSRVAEYAAQLAEKDAEIEAKNKIIQSFDTSLVVDCIEKYSASTSELLKNILNKMISDGYDELAKYVHSEFSKKDEFVSDLVKRLNFLSLSATKKSEKFVPRDENGLAKGQTLDEKNPNIKHPKKEDAKARGNNGAHHDPHDEMPYEENVCNVYPCNMNPDDPSDMERYEMMERRETTMLTYVSGYFRRQLCALWKVHDRKTGQILNAKVPHCPIKGSSYSSSVLSRLLVSKFAWHQTVTIIAEEFSNEGFNANEGTLNALIMKLGRSLFFRNLDTTLYLAVLSDDYYYVDESPDKMRVDSANIDSEFIKECWLWGVLAAKLKLIWYCSKEGSRRDKVGYEILAPVDHPSVVQADGKSCYRNLGDAELFENIVRVGCIHHVARKFKNLNEPKAQMFVHKLGELYHIDNIRIELAAKDVIAGKEWSKEDHLRWRKENLLPKFEEIVQLAREMLEAEDNRDSESKDPPMSKELRSAIGYTLNEEEAIKRIFTCGELCTLDQNAIERENREFSYHRKHSQGFGSVEATEIQAVFISLFASAKMHKVNVTEYMKFLLDQMSTMEDCVIVDKNSKNFELFRNILPDRYAESHKAEKITYERPKLPDGPLNPGAKRGGYKKHYSMSANNPDLPPNPDVGWLVTSQQTHISAAEIQATI